MKEKFTDLVNGLRDPVRSTRQDLLREVERTWSDHDLYNFRIFARGLQAAQASDVCYALADAMALPLLELLGDFAEMDGDIRPMAMRSLGGTPVSARLEIGRRLLKSGNVDLRVRTCAMLAEAGRAAVDLLSLALSDPEEGVVLAALATPNHETWADSPNLLSALFSRPEPVIRGKALDILSNLKNCERYYVVAGVKMLNDHNEPLSLRRSAAMALGKGRVTVAEDDLIRIVQSDENSEMRLVAAEALVYFGDPSAAEALLQASESEDEGLAAGARRSLSRFSPDAIFEACRERIADGNDRKMLSALAMLGDVAPVNSEGLLRDVLINGKDAKIRMAAAEALGEGGFMSSWDALAGMLENAGDERGGLLAAMGRLLDADRLLDFCRLAKKYPEYAGQILHQVAMAGKTSKFTQELKDLLAEWLNSPDFELSVQAAEALAFSGPGDRLKRVMAVLAKCGPKRSIRPALKALLAGVGGELAPLFADALPETAILAAEAAEECDLLGDGGDKFFSRFAGWVAKGVPGASEGLAAAAALDTDCLVRSMETIPDCLPLVEAWAGMGGGYDRDMSMPNWSYVFTRCDAQGRLRVLEIMSKLKGDGHLHAVARRAFDDDDERVRAAARNMIRVLVRGTGAVQERS